MYSINTWFVPSSVLFAIFVIRFYNNCPIQDLSVGRNTGSEIFPGDKKCQIWERKSQLIMRKVFLSLFRVSSNGLNTWYHSWHVAFFAGCKLSRLVLRLRTSFSSSKYIDGISYLSSNLDSCIWKRTGEGSIIQPLPKRGLARQFC